MLLLLSVVAHAGCDLAVEDGRIPDASLGFASRSAELTPASAAAIEGVGCLLKEDPALTVQVEVHTDSQGSGAYNQKMSQDRADAVRAALIAAGADGARITAVGYGETHPIAPNTTAEGRGQNRRIELHTVPPSERPAPPEAPEPPPVVPPTPRPAPVDVCAQARLLRPDAVPTWPGASCGPMANGWSCVVPKPFETLAAELEACIDGAQRDGDELWLTMHGASMVFRGVGSGTRVEPR